MEKDSVSHQFKVNRNFGWAGEHPRRTWGLTVEVLALTHSRRATWCLWTAYVPGGHVTMTMSPCWIGVIRVSGIGFYNIALINLGRFTT